jgi:hypothetical protein
VGTLGTVPTPSEVPARCIDQRPHEYTSLEETWLKLQQGVLDSSTPHWQQLQQEAIEAARCQPARDRSAAVTRPRVLQGMGWTS